MSTEAASDAIDSADFRRVLGHFPTGVVVITAVHDGEPAGLAIGSFSSVSLDPPLVGFFPAKSSSTWPRIEAAGSFCVNVLHEDQGDVCRTFAQSGGDKFSAVTWEPAPTTGAPLLDGALAWIDCRLDQVVDGGDHYFVMGLVTALGTGRDGGPLVFFRGKYGGLDFA